MCLYGKKEIELGRQEAPGMCPFCGGKVEAVDYKGQWRFCFMLICFTIKRKYICTLCSKRLDHKEQKKPLQIT
ncbi:hypothetical protein ACSBR1_026198 [Camellia fascicularis]